MRKTEEIAKLVIEAALPGTEMKPNLSQSHGEYDFHLHYLGGNVAAVEVTESAIQLQKQISAEIQNNQGKKLIIEAKKCKKSWWIIPMENADLSSIRGKVDTYLSSLEQAGREKFDF